MHECKQCGKKMNPVDWMLGPVCMTCTKKNHAAVTAGGKPKKSGKKWGK
jgi:hypothetical protein